MKKVRRSMKKHVTPEAITTAAAARRLGVSTPTIRLVIKSGALRAIQVGGQLRILLADFDKYIRERETRAA